MWDQGRRVLAEPWLMFDVREHGKGAIFCAAMHAAEAELGSKPFGNEGQGADGALREMFDDLLDKLRRQGLDETWGGLGKWLHGRFHDGILFDQQRDDGLTSRDVSHYIFWECFK
jgi:hypothetical protein